MTIHARLVSIVIGLALVLGTDAFAASKRKAKGGKSRPAATKPYPAAAKPPAGDPAEAQPLRSATFAPVKNGGPAPQDPRPAEKPVAHAESVKQESRIEFDERMLKGQSASGVIYLFQRTPSEWKSIVEVPGSFRPRTVEIVEGETK